MSYPTSQNFYNLERQMSRINRDRLTFLFFSFLIALAFFTDRSAIAGVIAALMVILFVREITHPTKY
jgi:hypothetical protein